MGDNSRARTHFKTGRVKILIVTERFYFFRRMRLSGVKNLLFFDLPLNALFYKELVDTVVNDGKVCALFSKYDGDRLERVIGSDKKITLINSAGETFLMQ